MHIYFSFGILLSKVVPSKDAWEVKCPCNDNVPMQHECMQCNGADWCSHSKNGPCTIVYG